MLSKSGHPPDGTVEEKDGAVTIIFERIFAQPVEEVWDALTRPERIAEWWLPFEAEIELELVEGGRYVMRRTGSESLTMAWTVLRVEPPVLLEHTGGDPGSVVRWQLQPEGERCRLLLTQTVPSRILAVERQYLVGLHTSLERLTSLLEGAPIAWPWDRFEDHRERYAANGLAQPKAAS